MLAILHRLMPPTCHMRPPYRVWHRWQFVGADSVAGSWINMPALDKRQLISARTAAGDDPCGDTPNDPIPTRTFDPKADACARGRHRA